MRIEVDLARCKAYANCVMEAPDIFDIDGASGKVSLLTSTPDALQGAEARAAAASCPVRAIVVIE
jgi:ferredoxin